MVVFCIFHRVFLQISNYSISFHTDIYHSNFISCSDLLFPNYINYFENFSVKYLALIFPIYLPNKGER